MRIDAVDHEEYVLARVVGARLLGAPVYEFSQCKEGEWAVQAYVRDHADAPECMKSYMTEGALAAFKSQVATEDAA